MLKNSSGANCSTYAIMARSILSERDATAVAASLKLRSGDRLAGIRALQGDQLRGIFLNQLHEFQQ